MKTLIAGAVCAVLTLAPAMAQEEAPTYTYTTADGEVFECVNHRSYDFGLDAAGAERVETVVSLREARAEVGVFASGLSLTISAQYCSHPAYQVVASFPVRDDMTGPIGAALALTHQQGCTLADADRARVGEISQALLQSGSYAPDDYFFVMSDMFGLGVTAHRTGDVVSLVSHCEIYGVGG